MSLAFVCINKYKLYVVLDFIDSAGQLVVKYKYTAYGKVTVTKDVDGLADSISFANNAVDSGGNFFCASSGVPVATVTTQRPCKKSMSKRLTY